MARQYVIKKGDTLGKVAKEFYNDYELYKKLAEYNGILNPDLVMLGQTIEIPSKAELIGGAQQPAINAGIARPHGLQEILDLFGDIFEFIEEDGELNVQKWQRQKLTHARLPFPIPLSWDPSKSVTRLLCHKRVAEIFPEALATIQNDGLQDQIRTFGGCYNFRSKRSSGKLSTHSWGIAIDLNPQTNPMGKPGDMHPEVVEIFRRFGFKWGGDWSGRSKDPMHFQFCTGY